MENILSRRDTLGVREILLETTDTDMGVQNHLGSDIFQYSYCVFARLLPNLTFPMVPEGDVVELCLTGNKIDNFVLMLQCYSKSQKTCKGLVLGEAAHMYDACPIFTISNNQNKIKLIILSGFSMYSKRKQQWKTFQAQVAEY